MTDADRQLGLLALKGGRYEEADRRFTHIVQATDSAEAWMALAIAKFGLLADLQTTVAEVAYCADLARQKAGSVEDERDIEATIAGHAVMWITRLYAELDRHDTALRKARERNSQALAMAALATVFGTSAKTPFGMLASYDVFRRSTGAISLSATEEAEMASERVLGLAEELRTFLHTFSAEPNAEYQHALATLKQVEDQRLAPEDEELESSAREADVLDLATVADTWGGCDLFLTSSPWHVRIGTQDYVAESFRVLMSWVAERRIPAEALVWNDTFSGWTFARALEPLRDALRMPPMRGVFVARCPICRDLFGVDLAKLRFFFGWAKTKCRRCDRSINIERSRLTADQRLASLRGCHEHS
jgi:hypothetical protein